MNYIKDPKKIEGRSFEIITEELGDKIFPEREGKIIKRVIHTTADFEYADLVEIKDGAIDSAMKALKNSSKIYCDTNMILSGINKRVLKKLGCEAYTLIADVKVSKEAKERGLTRSIVGMEKACEDNETKIFIIGNAPTALFTLKKLIEEGKINPALVIAVPVGFVGASESKQEIKKVEVPYILTNGRKGGSTVAVSILNAILYQMEV